MLTDVMFRRERTKDGEVTAVFPGICGNDQYQMCCYTHVGQHSACVMEWYYGTRPATYDEYKALLFELQGIYTDGLRVVKRITKAHRAARDDQMKALR